MPAITPVTLFTDANGNYLFDNLFAAAGAGYTVTEGSAAPYTDAVDTFQTRDVLYVELHDTDENRNPQTRDTFTVALYVGNDTDATIVDYIRGAQYRRVLLGMIDEVLAVAAAENVTPLGFNGFEPNAFRHHDAEAIARSLEALAAYNGASAKPYSGVWRDIVVRKRGTDVAAQLAPVCAVARARGVPTPLIDTLIAIVGEVEAGRTAVGADAFAPLDALAGNA